MDTLPSDTISTSKLQSNGTKYFNSWQYKVNRWLSNVNHFITHPFQQVKRIIEYIPVLWHDEDWDWHYIFRMLRYKIKRTREHMAICTARGENWERDNANMQRAENLLTRILDDDYMSKEWEEHHQKYPMEFEKTPEGMYRMKERGEEVRAKTREITNKGTELYNKDWDELWELLKNQIGNWWD